MIIEITDIYIHWNKERQYAVIKGKAKDRAVFFTNFEFLLDSTEYKNPVLKFSDAMLFCDRSDAERKLLAELIKTKVTNECRVRIGEFTTDLDHELYPAYIERLWEDENSRYIRHTPSCSGQG